MDTHLTSTYLIALRLGYSDADAQRIASRPSDWSLDLSANTSAMPSATKTGNYWFSRGASYHSLGSSPNEVYDRLNAMRDALQDSSTSPDDKLVQLEYLHAIQDATLRANQPTYDILKQYRDSGGALPNVQSSDIIYTKDVVSELQ
jgi:hypothetical protein